MKKARVKVAIFRSVRLGAVVALLPFPVTMTGGASAASSTSRPMVRATKVIVSSVAGIWLPVLKTRRPPVCDLSSGLISCCSLNKARAATRSGSQIRRVRSVTPVRFTS